jgi:DNA-binding GntR family transcriptional regulator
MDNKILMLLQRYEKETNKDYSYRVIKRNILTMNLVPGSIINENEFAEQLNISRTPIHEAVTILKSENLVDIFPQSGSRVSLINFQNVKDGVFLRNLIETAIYRELTDHLSLEYSKKIEENLEKTLKLYNTNAINEEKHENINLNTEKNKDINNHEIGIVELFSLDDEFHRLAYEAANRGSIWNCVKNACTHFDRIRYAEFAMKKSDLKHVYDEHMLIYEYLLVGGLPSMDFEQYYNKHLTFFKNYFFEIYKENPQYFVVDSKINLY